ncbi:MAG: carbon-nitrogen hydrolase family protein [Proteobacteria bacterium]|nr:carbon-nitrogen hydrolase family protein [Pseudomonadota bacterium]
MTLIRVAIVQDAPIGFDRQATLDKVARLTKKAAGQGAQVVVFPEAFLSAYPKGIDFGARVGTRSPEGRRWFSRYWHSAVEVPGPATDALATVAKECGAYLVVGVIERAAGTLYCTALIVGPEDGLLGLHRKLVPTAMERVVWGNGDGSTLPVVNTAVGRLGTVICWENYMPLLRTAMYAKGVQLYCAITVDDRPSWIPTVRHIAVEGRCFVLSSCQFARRSDYPDDYPADFGGGADAVAIRGGSCVVDPFGNVIAGPLYDEAGIITAEVDLDAIVQGKYDLDVTGHYARPDVFTLLVDERPRSAVQSVSSDDVTS